MHARAYVFLALFILSACGSSEPEPEPPHRLQVALYPYVPRLGQFEAVLQSMWTRTDVELEIVSWDGYFEEPTEDLDVFVFDAIYFDHFREQGYLAPIPEDRIRNISDFLPYAIDGSRVDGQLYAVPQLGCASLLFYRDGDQALVNATSLDEVANAIGACTFSEEAPPENTGLMVGIGDPIITASYYVEALLDLDQTYTPSPSLASVNELDAAALTQVARLASLSSQAHGNYYDPAQPWQRAVWFGEGRGRAMVGFTESLSQMSEAARSTVRFRPLPLAGSPDIHLYYADLVGMNRALDRPETPAVLRDAALELVDLLASTDYVVASFGPDSANPGSTPQYIMPTRNSVFDAFGADYPLYEDMRTLFQSTQPRLFRMGPSARNWLDTTGAGLVEEVRSQVQCPGS